MSNTWEDLAHEQHMEDVRITEIYKEWFLLAKEVKFDDSEKDDVKLGRLRDIEFDIDSYFENRGEDISDEFEWIKTWSPLSKEEKLKIQEKQGGRPKSLHTEEQKTRLRKRYYHLIDKIGHSKTKCLEILKEEFPFWSISTIDTYLKR